MKEPLEFSCMDDSPLNNGWGYNSRLWDDDEEPEEEDEDDYEEDI